MGQVDTGVTAASCGENCKDGLPHEWDGPVKEGSTDGGGTFVSGTCSKCGTLRMDWMLMHLDFEGDQVYVHMTPKESASDR